MNTEPSITPPAESSEKGYMSRKERREMQRSGNLGGQNSERRKRMIRRFMIWGSGVAVIALVGWGIIKLSSNIQLPTDGSELAIPVSDTDNTKGSSAAPIVVVEYSDFQCPACAAFYPLIKQLLAEPDAKDKVKFVNRHFPLSQIHPNAQLSAQAAQAAGLQNKFWEMHDKLFENQTKWSGQSNTGARKTFIEYATELKLNVATFTNDMDSDQIKDKVKDDYAGGVTSTVDSTPTFFINGIRMAQVQSYEEFKQAILSAPTGSPSVLPTN